MCHRQCCEALECMPSRCWEVQEGEKNEGSVRGHLKGGPSILEGGLRCPSMDAGYYRKWLCATIIC